MAKKISKHSRAARRNELEEVDEIASLADLPRAAKTDVTSTIIRTTAKNESLLNAKLQKKDKKGKVSKAQNKTTLNIEKQKLERALHMSSVLDGKIEKSKQRARYVQNARKAGWEATNNSIKKELHGNVEQAPKKDEDAMDDEVENFYSDDEKTPVVPAQNAFALLGDDVEA